jgi:hypothetical protein
MTQDDIIAFVSGMPGVAVVTASEATAARTWPDRLAIVDTYYPRAEGKHPR